MLKSLLRPFPQARGTKGVRSRNIWVSNLANAAVRARQLYTAAAFSLKILPRLKPGLNPELEVGRFLMEKTSFPTKGIRPPLDTER